MQEKIRLSYWKRKNNLLNSKKAVTGASLLILLLSIGGVVALVKLLSIGAIVGIAGLFATPLFWVVLILFIIFWANKK